MKRNLVFLLTLATLTLDAQDKHALIIAAGNYSPQTTWSNISSVNDVPLIKEAIISRGFDESSIAELTSNVSKNRIIEALTDLHERVKPGDIVFIHYSGHGYQIPDDDGDETDGLDEALVPEDAPNDEGKMMDLDFYSNYIRDDYLKIYFDQLRTKLGPEGNVLFTVDACHSGTMTRGVGIARGAMRTEFPDQNDLNRQHTTLAGSDFGLVENDENMATMACIFGSSEHELNYEYHTPELQCGSLSYAFSAAITETNHNSSYQALFDQLRSKMAAVAPRQTPHAEGQFNQVMFGGQLLPKVQYHRISRWVEDDIVAIDVGQLASVHNGSKVSFYPADTREIDETSPLATGEIVQSRMASSNVKILTGSLDRSRQGSIWAFVTEKNFGDLNVSVKMMNLNDSQRKQIQDFMIEYKFISPVDDFPADILMEYESGTGDIVLTTHTDHVIYREATNARRGAEFTVSQMQDIVEKITQVGQVKLLRSLEVKDNPRFIGSIRIIPFELKEGGSPTNPKDYVEVNLNKDRHRPTDVLTLPDESYFKFQITNHGRAFFFYTVLEVGPDNDIEVIIPTKHAQPQEYRVMPMDSSITFDLFQLGPPYGDHMLKLIVSDKPMDLRGIVQTRGSGQTRGNNTSFERLLFGSYRQESNTRGSRNQTLDIENIGVFSLVYRIEDPRRIAVRERD